MQRSYQLYNYEGKPHKKSDSEKGIGPVFIEVLDVEMGGGTDLAPGWYFNDEGQQPCGPFKSFSLTQKVLKNYAAYLNNVMYRFEGGFSYHPIEEFSFTPEGPMLGSREIPKDWACITDAECDVVCFVPESIADEFVDFFNNNSKF